MHLAIITVCRNDLVGLRRTAASLGTLTADVEWIVQDGASTDGSVDWLSQHPVADARSEADRGIYDAMNRAIERTSSEWVIFLNAGDELATQDSVAGLLRTLSEAPDDADLLYGDAEEVTTSGQTRLRPARDASWLAHGMFTHHQAMMFRMRSIGSLRYREELTLSADYAFVADLLLGGARPHRVHKTIVRFHLGGASDVGRLRGLKEDAIVRRTILGQGAATTTTHLIAHAAHLALKRLAPGLTGRWRAGRA